MFLDESGNIPGIIVLNAGKDTSKKQMAASKKHSIEIFMSF